MRVKANKKNNVLHLCLKGGPCLFCGMTPWELGANEYAWNYVLWDIPNYIGHLDPSGRIKYQRCEIDNYEWYLSRLLKIFH